ncbi:alpha/beta hydrolase family protein [Amycolatopsis sp. NPDC088138]|uniref:alpha/beta hydrolase family protein n=1 Tax=Amycolatopsis sp. NPDC088138 TaxID=3363938 RepID=UPI0038145DDE
MRFTAVLAVLTGLLALPAPASASGTPYLPRPTGSHPVGLTTLDLTDTSRPDPWVPSVRARELMVSVWYPAAAPGRHRARYMTPEESRLLLADGGITTLPADILSTTRTNAFTDARPEGRAHSLPLVVLSPGFKHGRGTLTGLAEDLASHGYVVAAVDHTYESVGTSFPGGRVTTCAACDVPVHDEPFWQKVDAVRAKDVSFVLDELTGPRPKWAGAGLIDRSRIALAGHSAGGAAAVPAMLADSRIKAGIDFDGTTNPPQGALSRPFLLLGRAGQYTPGTGQPAVSWARTWAQLTGWKRWVLVDGAVHQSFSDLALLTDEFALPNGATTSGARSLQITRDYTRAFLDLHLRHRPQSVLDGPSAAYPEVSFCDPGGCS